MLNKLKNFFSKDERKKNFRLQFETLKRKENQCKKRFELEEKDFFPILHENTENTGFDRHYVYHPAWAARIIRANKPAKHIDISSSLHFCTLLSAFIPVDFYDYRPAHLELSNLKSLTGNVISLPFDSNTIISLSCMHTIEHIGLGRYGDEIDYDGDIKAITELKRVLAPGGSLFFVVPIGSKNKIHFNAHRVYTRQHVIELFEDLDLEEFALIPEDEKDGALVKNPSHELLARQDYGCGCFWFKKNNKA
jgi:SAM-dependent methyltransferase